MTLDWVRKEIMLGVRSILSAKETLARPAMLDRLATEIKVKLVRQWNEALNRVRQGAEASIEREREEV